ncbi:hypothetical protein [Haloflavibacter putidus]|uniref:tRNA (Guanine-N1)-methyltransferase n=1 Tax=Haloflavibacter putidus TaxID=2576776 RepID=A0A507ZUW7_9FLAO|nr:hypothetical protein [Haloflavibacter putidus]TQD40034.1 hypothetical protein FKR84_02230 [Haloflavibacter putidus]
MTHKIFVLATLFLFFGGILQAQNTGDKNINEQFEELLESSNNYQDYKVVKQYKLTRLQKSTVNHIKELKTEIDSANVKIAKQQSQIDKLQEKLNTANADLEQVNLEKDQIKFFGLPTDKGTYQTIMWLIVLGLVLILLFFIYRFKKSNALTKEAKHKLNENEEEFELYRKKALEKQQILGRQLQDERNKVNKNKQ